MNMDRSRALSLGSIQKKTRTVRAGSGDVPNGLGESGSAPQRYGTMQTCIEKNKTECIGNNHSQLIQKNKSVNVRDSDYIDVANGLIINAGKRILLKCAQNVILLNSDDSIQMNDKTLTNNFSDIIRMSVQHYKGKLK